MEQPAMSQLLILMDPFVPFEFDENKNFHFSKSKNIFKITLYIY